MKITVMCVVRDSERTLPFCLKKLEVLGKMYDMEYYFYENDSKDKTVEILETWMIDKEGQVYSEILNAPSFGHTTQVERMERMTYYRNTLLNHIKPLKSDYCLLLDADIDYTVDIVEKYLSHMKKDVVMCTPYIKQSVKCNMCNCNKQSYYDTFALQDKDNYEGILLSCNPFTRAEDRKLWDDKKPISVNSAFGGIALIRSKAVNDSQWGTKLRSSKFKNLEGREMGSCEHWAFCEGIKKHGKILVIPTIEAFVKIKSWELPPQQKTLQQRMIDDPWQRWAANL